MRNISDTIARLHALREHAMHHPASAHPASEGRSRLQPMRDFGSNPGDLLAYTYVPDSVAAGAPLVVVLHGCTQSAAGYDIGSGWSDMADRHGFMLLFPQQQRQNNPNLCFNWFSPADARRGSGEALSIRQMIDAFASRQRVDMRRVYVTGLSAGGAMASVMLASYPDVFAAGAIIAGLPYGSAVSVPQAFDRMRGHGMPEAGKLAALARAASDHQGPWPRLSVWQGTADSTVSPSNADALIAQWGALHGVAGAPDRMETVGAHRHRIWRDADGREVIEAYTITDMGHGTPLDTHAKDACGQSGAFMLEAGICSTHAICRFWGLADAGRQDQASAAQTLPPREDHAIIPKLASLATGTPRFHRTYDTPRTAPGEPSHGPVRKVIEDALRAAGLMR